MLGWLLFIGLCYLCYRNKPTEGSYIDYAKQQRSGASRAGGLAEGQSNKKSSWFSKIISKASDIVTRRPEYKYNDYLFFAITYDKDTRENYIGILGSWFLLSSGVAGSGGSNVSSANLSSVQVVSDSGEAEHYKELAVKAKVEKDYYAAYQNYSKSAQILSRGTKYDQIEAAATYEEAAKCANESEKKLEALKLAAKLFEANDSSVRAARIYERIGDMYSSRMEGAFSSTSSSVMSRNDRSTEAIDAFKRAIDCFKAQNDTRYLSIMTKMANSQCEAGKFEEAVVTLEEYFGSPDQRGASYELKKPFLTLGFCYLALNDPVRAQKWLHDFVDSKHPSLSQEREYKFLLGVIQGQMDNNSILFDETVSEYTNLQPISDKWKQNVLDKVRMDLDKDELT